LGGRLFFLGVCGWGVWGGGSLCVCVSIRVPKRMLARRFMLSTNCVLLHVSHQSYMPNALLLAIYPTHLHVEDARNANTQTSC
jgi:hypothetical protein